jgi:hypothetical protein
VKKLIQPLSRGFLMGLLLFVFACTGGPAPQVSEVPDTPIERAITAHGMDKLDSVNMSFSFRDRDYGIERNHGAYTYTRTYTDTLDRRIVDTLTNDGFVRLIDGQQAVLNAEDSTAFANSLNSVRYFVMLPYTLRDPAVQRTDLGEVTIDGQTYDRVKVTFAAAGGGQDHEDIYHYFFNSDNGELDYLAYSFDVNEGGLRFRKAINKRRVGGILLQDYVNYGVNGEDRDIDRVVEKYAAGELPELSVIENVAVRVN